MHIERLPARKYYGPHATGSVVLVNGGVAYHGKPWDAVAFEKLIRKGSKTR